MYSGAPGKGGNKHGRTPSMDWTVVIDTPYTGPSPDLPARKRNQGQWPVTVVDWWDEVRRMPHCVLWSPTDWRFALETAYLKMAMWNDLANGELKATLTTEIRRREDQMGTTREALRKLRIRYISPDEAAKSPGSDLVLYDPADPGGPDEDVINLDERRRRVAEG